MHASVLWLLVALLCAVHALSEEVNPFLAAIGEFPQTVGGPGDAVLGHGRAVSQEIHGELDMDITQPHHLEQKQKHSTRQRSRKREHAQSGAELKAEAFDTLLKQQVEELIKSKGNKLDRKRKHVQEHNEEWVEAEVSHRHSKTAKAAFRQRMLTPKASIEEESPTKELLDPVVRQNVHSKNAAKKALRAPIDVSLGMRQLLHQMSKEQKEHRKDIQQLRRKIDALKHAQGAAVQEVRQVHDELSAVSARVDAMIDKVEEWKHEAKRHHSLASESIRTHTRLQIPATKTVKRND